jgi:hypothetical protein
MFHTRITESWSAPVEVQDRYLLERLIELPTGERLVCARERKSGLRWWVKFAANPEVDPVLQLELAALHAVSHPAIAKVIDSAQPGQPAWVALEWQGEGQISHEMLERLPSIERLRVIESLTSAVSQLAAARIALPGLELHHLWLTPALHSLRFVGLSGAQPSAPSEALAMMQRAAAQLINSIMGLGLPAGTGAGLAGLVSDWGVGECEGGQLLEGLRRALMLAVTADL